MISDLQTTGLTLASAEQKVLAAFGLPPGTDLTTLDPIAGAKGGDTVSAEVYAAGAKVIDTVDAIASAFQSAGKSFLGAFADADAALSSDINTLATGQSLSLTDQPILTALINSVAQTEGVNTPSFVVGLSANIAASNASVDQKLAQNGAGANLIAGVSSVQAAVQSQSNASAVRWQNANGQTAIWEMNDTKLTASAVVAKPGPNWKAVGTGDFNDDGHSDILLQNTNGAVAIWEMNGAGLTGSAVVANPGSNWKAVGTGDFNDDGHSDILLQNTNGSVAIWDMGGTNGTSVMSSAVVAKPGTSWRAIGTGDFDGAIGTGGEGSSDILFQNTSGQTAIWDMHGTNIASAGAISPNPGSSWKAIGLT
jgi:FG-GAP-like repeat